MKENYKKLADKMENRKKMEDLYLKLDYEKNLLVIFKYFIQDIFFRTKKKKGSKTIKQGKYINFSKKEKDNKSKLKLNYKNAQKIFVFNS